MKWPRCYGLPLLFCLVSGCSDRDVTNDPAANPPIVDRGPEIVVDTPGSDVVVDLNEGRPAANGGVDVDVRPGAGVDVNIDGTPIRDRLQERREARDAATEPANP